MSKKLLVASVLAGSVVLGGIAAAASSTTSTFNFNFPAYAYVYTNVGTVDFDFAAAGSGTHPGQLSTLTSSGVVKVATADDLQACMSGLVTGNPTIPASATAATGANALGPATCNFSPTNVTESGYTVGWPSGDATDGSVLLVTNTSTFHVKVVVGAFSGITQQPVLSVTPGLVKNGGIGGLGSPASMALTASGVQLGSSNAFFTSYSNVRVIPVLWEMSINPTAYDQTASTSATVTYTGIAP